jgi:predicted DCC family thiol-disulfide oxidoreductase YuxK
MAMTQTNQGPHFAKPTVLYDGLCGICQRSVEIAKRLDREKALTFVPYLDVEIDVLQQVGLSRDKCATHLRVVTPGEDIFTGAFAVNFIAFRLGLLRLLVGLIYLVPPILVLEVILYEIVSRNRQELSQKLGLAVCNVPARPNVSRGNY